MQTLFETYLNKIHEEIQGDISFIYHRTKEENVKQIIEQKKFIIGKRTFYGPAIYFNFSLKSALNKEMDSYGNYLIYSSVNMKQHKFLMFGEIYDSIENQLKKFGLFDKLNGNLNIPDNEKMDMYSMYSQRSSSYNGEPKLKILQEIENFSKGESNEIFLGAKLLVDYFPEITKEVDGLFFYEYREGYVCVVYKPEIINVISYSEVIGNQLVGWQKN